ncbi:MAG: flavodoxin family protein, partial [Kiritimatiellota bacterium]|nr:flavodoxin family protein [Kiritimatiellota bacterium]
MATASGMLNDMLASAGWMVKAFVLREMKIADCVGCFGCWIKKPGRCIINDSTDDIARALVNS